jgi:hypothetical protein
MALGKIYIGGARNKDKTLWVGFFLYPYSQAQNSPWEINVSASTQELADKYMRFQEHSFSTADHAKAEVENLLNTGDLPILPWEEHETELTDPPPGRLPRGSK